MRNIDSMSALISLEIEKFNEKLGNENRKKESAIKIYLFWNETMNNVKQI